MTLELIKEGTVLVLTEVLKEYVNEGLEEMHSLVKTGEFDFAEDILIGLQYYCNVISELQRFNRRMKLNELLDNCPSWEPLVLYVGTNKLNRDMSSYAWEHDIDDSEYEMIEYRLR